MTRKGRLEPPALKSIDLPAYNSADVIMSDNKSDSLIACNKASPVMKAGAP
jgi:hypothetical protein